MRINDYIKVDSDKVYNNKTFKLYYSGYLTEVSENEPILLRYGNEDWKNARTVEMQKDENNRLYAEIKLNNFNKMNFCFTYDNVWDNNFSNDYSLEVSRYNMEKYVSEEEHLENYFADDFLLAYNLNKKDKEAKDIPYVTNESEIYENAMNIESPNTELQNLKESLEKLFPESKAKRAETTEEIKNISEQFADSFSTNTLYADDFVEITDNDELEIYKPKIPYRQTLLALIAARDYESEYISNIVIEDQPVILKSNTQYIHVLREIARKNELARILELSNNEESKFLVVSPYSEVDIYDNSLIGTLKRYSAYVSKSMKKIYYYLKENLSTDEIN